MSLQSAFVEWLKSKATVTAVVGSGSSARIYPDIAPADAALPFIVYQRVSNVHGHHLTAADGLVRCSLQVSAWATSRKASFDLAEILRAVLDGFKQATFGAGAETLYVGSIFLESDLDNMEQPQNASDRGGYRTLQDYTIWYRESVPTPQA